MNKMNNKNNLKNKIILFLSLLLLFTLCGCNLNNINMTGNDDLYLEKDNLVDTSKMNFCDRFNYFNSNCWCSNTENDGLLYDTGDNIKNYNDAKNLLKEWFEVVKDNYDFEVYSDDNYVCESIGNGFYNCYILTEIYVTISENGDIYKTECGV
jgi:hypothetical protein